MMPLLVRSLKVLFIALQRCLGLVVPENLPFSSIPKVNNTISPPERRNKYGILRHVITIFILGQIESKSSNN